MKQSLYELLEELEEYFDQRRGDEFDGPEALKFRDRIREHLQPVKDEEE